MFSVFYIPKGVWSNTPPQKRPAARSHSDTELTSLLPKKQHSAAFGHGDNISCVLNVRSVYRLIEFVEHDDRTVFGSCHGDGGVCDAVGNAVPRRTSRQFNVFLPKHQIRECRPQKYIPCRMMFSSSVCRFYLSQT